MFGGKSTEHEVSVRSAKSIYDAIDRSRYEVLPIAIAKGGSWVRGPQVLAALESGQAVTSADEKITLLPDPNSRSLVSLSKGGVADTSDASLPPVVFPVLHGRYGEDGAIQGLLEMSNLPYVGCGVLSSAIGMDKIKQKEILAYHGIPIVRFAQVSRSRWRGDSEHALTDIETALSRHYPLFVKPANTGSSVGISKAKSRDQLRSAITLAFQYDSKVVIEEGIDRAREIEVSVFGNQEPSASVCGEIVPAAEFYDYNSKYHDDRTQLIIPAQLPPGVGDKVREVAKRAYQISDCRGLSRVDFLVTREDQPRVFLNEINTLPGFTNMSMYPKLWEATGVSYTELVEKLIGFAVEEWEEKQLLKTSF